MLRAFLGWEISRGGGALALYEVNGKESDEAKYAWEQASNKV